MSLSEHCAAVSPKICIHIGFPKTGTTTLQSLVFDRHREIFNLGKPYAREEIEPLVRAVAVGDPRTYDRDAICRSFQASVQAAFQNTSAGLIMLSDERLTGAPRVPRALQAARVHDLFGDCKIVIVIREQREMLRSMYLQAMRGANVKRAFAPLDQWLAEAAAQADTGPLARLNYVDTVDAYSQRFGGEMVKVLLFETLVKDSSAFIEELCDFLCIDPNEAKRLLAGEALNRRMSSADYRLKSVVSRFPHMDVARRLTPRPLRRLAKRIFEAPIGKETALSEEWALRISDHFRMQNQILMTRYRLPLDIHGYAA